MPNELKQDDLLDDIKNSILNMQNQIQDTYSDLADTRLIGLSNDKTVKIVMSATYAFEDIEFDERALLGGIKEFKWRVREAWKELSDKIQETTQNKTLELLQTMEIPDDIKNLGFTEEEDK